MVKFINDYGNITDLDHLAFEKRIGDEVDAYLQSLLDRGLPMAEVRVASHYIMAYLHVVESRVLLKAQMAAHKVRTARLNATDEGGVLVLKDLGAKLGSKIRKLSFQKYGPNAEGEYVMPEREYTDGMGADFDEFANGRPYRLWAESARKAYIFQFLEED